MYFSAIDNNKLNKQLKSHLIMLICMLIIHEHRIDAEDLFSPILNITFDYNLQNLNDEILNFPAIDLLDINQEVAFQITTSAANNTKIKNTIEKIEKYRNDETKYTEYFQNISKVYIIFLSSQKEYHIKQSKNDIEYEFFNIDVLLNKYIFKLSKEKKLLIALYLVEKVVQYFHITTVFDNKSISEHLNDSDILILKDKFDEIFEYKPYKMKEKLVHFMES